MEYPPSEIDGFDCYGFIGWPAEPENGIDPEFDIYAADWADLDEWEDEK